MTSDFAEHLDSTASAMDRYPSSMQPWGATVNISEAVDPHDTRLSNTSPTSAPGTAQGSQPPHHQTILQVCAEVKPRLTKEQHDILERHFQQQPKPSTHTKKGFADMLGVPLDKINNWFQNRRAKVKQDIKKQQNALAMLQAATGIPMHSQAFLPVSQPLPSSGPPEFISDELPMQPYGHPSVVSDAPMQQHLAYAHPQDFNGMPAMVPIMESTQPGSREGIVHSLQHAGYAVQHPPMSGPDDQFFANDVFVNPAYSEFPGAFAEMPPDMAEPFNSYSIPIPSIEGPQMSLQPVPSSASLAPSVASTYSHQSSYTEDSSQVITAATSTSPCDPGESNGFESHPESVQSWVAQNPVFNHPNPSAPALLSSETDSTPPELSSDVFTRRNSSTSCLTDSLSAVDIAVPNGDPDCKAPNQPSSLAARRQRPRPAALGAASLRSASYSVGMPASPGGNQNLAAPEQALRRIRSSGINNPSRIQKPGSSSGQRSPMTLAFADAAASPKWGRMSSGSYGSTFVTSPAISVSAASSIAPPTPPTPGEYNHYPTWQTPGAKVISAAGEVVNVNGVTTSYLESGAVSAGGVTFSSPPTTPLDTEQQAQYRSWLAQQHAHVVFRDTPPQSAPASQQCFNTSFVTHHPPLPPSALGLRPDKLGHLRRPSLPDGPHVVVPQQWPPVPLFTATGDLALAGSMEDGSVTAPPRVPFTNPFSGPPAHGGAPPSPAHAAALAKHEFAVLQYAPPEGGSIVAAGMPRADSVPKIYHFSNQGPRDFKG